MSFSLTSRLLTFHSQFVNIHDAVVVVVFSESSHSLANLFLFCAMVPKSVPQAVVAAVAAANYGDRKLISCVHCTKLVISTNMARHVRMMHPTKAAPKRKIIKRKRAAAAADSDAAVIDQFNTMSLIGSAPSESQNRKLTMGDCHQIALGVANAAI